MKKKEQEKGGRKKEERRGQNKEKWDRERSELFPQKKKSLFLLLQSKCIPTQSLFALFPPPPFFPFSHCCCQHIHHKSTDQPVRSSAQHTFFLFPPSEKKKNWTVVLLFPFTSLPTWKRKDDQSSLPIGSPLWRKKKDRAFFFWQFFFIAPKKNSWGIWSSLFPSLDAILCLMSSRVLWNGCSSCIGEKRMKNSPKIQIRIRARKATIAVMWIRYWLQRLLQCGDVLILIGQLLIFAWGKRGSWLHRFNWHVFRIMKSLWEVAGLPSVRWPFARKRELLFISHFQHIKGMRR